AHCLVEAGQGEGVHAVAQQLAQDLHRLRITPLLARDRIEPHGSGIGVQRALHPDRAGFFVEMLDRAARMGDLVRTHRGIADKDQLIVMPIFVEDVPGGRALLEAAAIVLPHALVQAIVEVEELQVLELAGRRGEQLLAKLDERIHRSADVEEEQQLHGIVPLGAHVHVEPALF
ncbi:hypothetical protein QU38_02355, partial [Staphylococcus aureus]